MISIVFAALVGMQCYLCGNCYRHIFSNKQVNRLTATTTTQLKIYPLNRISQYSDFPGFNDTISVGLLEYNDLQQAAQLSFQCFYKARLNLNNKNMSANEKNFASFIVSLYTKFDKFDSWLSNYVGFRSRAGNKLFKPSLDANKDSTLLVAVDNTKPISQNIIGIVEICLDPPNGKLSPPLQFPWSKIKDSYEPYLSNLCVDSSYRGLGIGKFLCCIGEDIAKNNWKKSSMYLHVENDNIAAVKMYESIGYQKIEGALTAYESKMLNMDDIYYYNKKL